MATVIDLARVAAVLRADAENQTLHKATSKISPRINNHLIAHIPFILVELE